MTELDYINMIICHINRRKLENPSIFISSQFQSHIDPGNVRRKCLPDHKNTSWLAWEQKGGTFTVRFTLPNCRT